VDIAHTRSWRGSRLTRIRSGQLEATGAVLTVTDGQLAFEVRHLLAKLRTRDRERHELLASVNTVTAHPVFQVVEGEIEPWEKVQ